MTSENQNEVIKLIEMQVNNLRSLNTAIKALEDQVALHKASKRELEEQVIPDIMFENGLNSLTLSSGLNVTVKPFYFARVPKDNPTIFYEWLDANGHGGLIKTHLEVWTTDHNIVELMKEFCEEMGISIDVARGIHWKTLEAWFKEQMEKRVNLPTTLFENYVGKRAVVK